MEKKASFLKTTIIGGIIFLIPIVIIVAILEKAIKMMMIVVKPLNELIPVDSVGGIALIKILAILAVVVVSFLAGLFARSKPGRVLFSQLDSKLMMIIPGYSFVKGFAGSFSKDSETVLKPVMAKFDDTSQLGFEVERMSSGLVAIFVPSSPDTFSGSVIYMTEDRVEPINVDFASASSVIRHLGHGSKKILKSENKE